MKFHSSSFAAAALLSSLVPSAGGFGLSSSLAAQPAVSASRSAVQPVAPATLGRRATAPPTFGVRPRPATALGLAGGGGPEALEDYAASLSAESKLTSKVRNPKLVRLAGVATIPLTYALGLAATPSRRLAVRAVGGVLAAATAGGIGKSAVEEDVRRSCPAAMARRLRDMGLDDPLVSDAIAKLAEDYEVCSEDFEGMKTDVYAVYLNGMAKNPLTKTAELKEIAGLRSALSLNNQQVGQGHADAASNFYRDVSRFTTEDELDDPGHPDRISLDKLLFLTERALRQGGETDEAFAFELSRVASSLGELGPDEALERAKGVARPFYERALSSTRAKLNSGAVSSDMLSRARSTLGIEEWEAREMHIEAFGKEVRAQLGLPEEEDEDDEEDAVDDVHIATEAEGKQRLQAMKDAAGSIVGADTSQVKFIEEAYDRLSQLQSVFEMTDEDADYEISAATVDYWRQTALSALEDVIAGIVPASKAWDVIHTRQKELYIKDSAMEQMLTSIVMQALGRPLERVAEFSRVNNAAATYDGLVDAIAAKEKVKQVLVEAGWADEFEGFEQAVFDPSDGSSAVGFLKGHERQNMYQIFFLRSVKPDETGVKNISAEAQEQLKVLRGMLAVSEEAGVVQVRNFFGPQLQAVLTKATAEIMRGNPTEELLSTLKADVTKVIHDFDLDDEMVRSYVGPLYSRAVEDTAARTPGGIPSPEENDTLRALRDLLTISDDEMGDAHLKIFAPAYQKGVKEALGTTGVIREEFRAPLEDLRERLGVSEEAARNMYTDSIADRMKPMVEFISQEMERLVLSNDQLAQKRGADYGDDFFKDGSKATGKLGLGTDGNIMSDIMNLIDFYVENDVVRKEVVGTKKVERTEDGETVTEEEPVYESTYPVTGLGLGVVTQQVAELCYRQFVVSSFTDQSPSAARYEASKSTFGGILGLTTEKMEEIGGSIGGMVYDNYIKQALSTKPALDQQDMMFLANIQGKLGLTSEQGEQFLQDTQKKIVSEEASALFDSGVPSIERLREFREKCNTKGLDLQDDVGLTKARVVSMFAMEITPGIDSGDVTIESADYLAEVQESLGLTEEEGEDVISSLIRDRATGIMGDVVGCMLRGIAPMAVTSMEKLVQYAAFVDGDLGLEMEEGNAIRAVGLFESKDWTGADEETREGQVLLLKKAFGMKNVD